MVFFKFLENQLSPFLFWKWCMLVFCSLGIRVEKHWPALLCGLLLVNWFTILMSCAMLCYFGYIRFGLLHTSKLTTTKYYVWIKLYLIFLWWIEYITYLFIKLRYSPANHQTYYGFPKYCRRFFVSTRNIFFPVLKYYSFQKLWFWNALTSKRTQTVLNLCIYKQWKWVLISTGWMYIDGGIYRLIFFINNPLQSNHENCLHCTMVLWGAGSTIMLDCLMHALLHLQKKHRSFSMCIRISC